jgi:Cu(I)/Ag(I) efflux system membrane fusion protein
MKRDKYIAALFVLMLTFSTILSGCAPHGNASKTGDEKSLEEVCVEHKCTMKNCAMSVKTGIRPGERIICPICGEVISTASGRVVEIIKQPLKTGPIAPLKKERKLLYYRNPMDPRVTSPVPMKDPMGMDYVPVYEEGSGEEAGRTITISPEKQQLIGVKTEPVEKMDLEKVIRASGKIAYDPELVVTQEEFIQALNAEDNVKDSPLQDVINRTKDLAEAARRKLKLLGMGDDQIADIEKTRKAQTNLYLPGKGESVWAYISIYEYEIGLVKPGDLVEIEAVAYPGEKFSGKVVSINPVLDAISRTNQVRVEVENTGDKLKPEMFVNANIKVALGKKLAVPEAAVLDTGLRKIVYLSKEGDVLESREVALGQKAEGYYEVLSGLKEGDVVVTSGNFLVDSETKLKAPLAQ